jgi:hypothetical protein
MCHNLSLLFCLFLLVVSIRFLVGFISSLLQLAWELGQKALMLLLMYSLNAQCMIQLGACQLLIPALISFLTSDNADSWNNQQEHLFIVTELLRANLYEFQKYNQESGDEVYFSLPRIQVSDYFLFLESISVYSATEAPFVTFLYTFWFHELSHQ